MGSSSGWEIALSIVTTITQVVMTLSPVPDLYHIHKAKSTGEMVVFPLVAMIVNNNVWTMYGYMTNSMFPLFATSLFGEIIATLYTVVYFVYCPDRAYVLRTVAVGGAVFAATTTYVALGSAGVTHQSLKQVYTIHGWIAVAINIFMYASPLEKVHSVIQTKNSAPIPINLSVMIFVNCCLWVATAVVDNDVFVLTPNCIGVVLTTVQIVLYFVYRPKKTQAIPKDELVEIAINNGNAIEPVSSPVVAFEPLRSPLAPLRG